MYHQHLVSLGMFAAAVVACSSTSESSSPDTPPVSAGGSDARPSVMTVTNATNGAAGTSGSVGAGSSGSSGVLEPSNPSQVALSSPDSGLPGPSGGGGGGGGEDAAAPTDVPAPGGVFGLGGPSRCGNGGLSVCESFEAATPGAAVPAGWTTGGYGNRTLAVVEDDRARGARSLRIDVAGNQGAVVGMLIRDNLGALGARYFGRSFMKIAAPAPTGFVHFDAFEARGDYEGQTNMVRWASTGTNVGTGGGNWSWIYNVQSTDHGEFGSEGPRSAHPRDGEWMCLEWFMEAAAQEARFWYDGAEIDYLHIDTERAEIPVFDSFHVGFQKFQQTAGAWRVWVDEIAFDDERIGCDG